MPQEIDRERTEALAAEIMRTLRPVLTATPPSSDHVFVVLNAIAFVVATIVAGADIRALEFFIEATTDNLDVVRSLPQRRRFDA